MTLDLDILTEQLRSIRHPDESAVIISIGSVRCSGCGPVGAIQVVASKGKHTVTSEALRLEDAILMTRARLREAEERDRKEREEAKKGKAA